MERHLLELVYTLPGCQDSLLILGSLVYRIPQLVGVLDYLGQIVGIECVEHIEEVVPVGQPLLGNCVGEVPHELFIDL